MYIPILQENTHAPKCDSNKAALQLYWNRTLAWVFCCKFAAYFQNNFFKEHIWRTASEIQTSLRFFRIPPDTNFLIFVNFEQDFVRNLLDVPMFPIKTLEKSLWTLF